jgi:hypothetical protein
MSSVTDILLCTGLADGIVMDSRPHPSADALSRWLVERHGPACALKQLNGYAGGNKAMQADVFGGAVNYCDTEGLLAAFRAIPWDDREAVQLLVKEEHDSAFRVYGLDQLCARPPVRNPPDEQTQADLLQSYEDIRAQLYRTMGIPPEFVKGPLHDQACEPPALPCADD